MKLFTVGPVEMDPSIREVGSRYLPYFRTPEFSAFMLGLEKKILKAIDAPQGARSVLLTASGSGALEAAVTGVFTPKDKLLVINGGTFGQRFVDICRIHQLPHTEVKVPFDQDLSIDDLASYEGHGYTGVLVQGHETSIGKRYDLAALGSWCMKEGAVLVADCVSAFLVDPISMKDMGIDVFITASQKSLALPPGLTIVAVSQKVLEDRIKDREPVCLYLDLADAFKNQERGQTPFTPALSIIYQLDARLDQIEAAGGVESELKRAADLAAWFRTEVVRRTPFRLPQFTLSNGLTPLLTGEVDAYQLFLALMEKDGQVITPCGGDQAHRLTRVGHMGYLFTKDFDHLLECMIQYIDRSSTTD